MGAPSIDPEQLSEHTAALRRMARGLLGEDAGTDDLVQSTFLTALERPPRTVTSLRAWLRRVLSSRASDVLRERSRRRDVELAVANEQRLSSDEVDQRFDAADELVDAVRKLGEPYREVVFLRYFEDLPPRAIARRLGIPVDTVKTRLARALAELRERLARSRDGDPRAWVVLLESLAGRASTDIPPLSASAPALPVGLGGTLMWKKLTLLATVLLAVLVVWRASDSSLPRADDVARTPAHSQEVATDATARPGDDAAAARARRALPVKRAETRAEPTKGALLVRAVWSDQTPAAGLGLRITPTADPVIGRPIREVVTDEQGLARIDHLAAGTVLIESNRFGRDAKPPTRAEVVAGEERTAVFRQAAGVTVSGVVVDEQGQPVAGARVWLASWRNDWRGGAIAATCDMHGRFELRDIDAGQSVGAFAAGYAPSPLVDLELLEEPGTPLRLALRGSGASLHGRVIDPLGAPVAGARVAVGRGPYLVESRMDGTSVERWTPRVGTTASDGTFELIGLETGRRPVRVLAEGLAEWKTEIDLAAGTNELAEIRLERGTRVRGIVRDVTGAPVENALVIALDEPHSEVDPVRGPVETGRAFLWPAVRSDAQGAYELPPVPRGDVYLWAAKGASFWGGSSFAGDRGAPYLGSALAELHAGDEEVLQWDPVLDVGPVIRGRVIYADGAPMVWVYVTAVHEETGRRFCDPSTDQDGSFWIPGLDPGTYTLSVHDGDAPPGAEPIRLAGVWPSEQPVELVAARSRERVELGRVAGRLVDGGSRLAPGSEPYLLLESEGPTWSAPATVDGERFHFDHVAPGHYRVRLLHRDDPVQTFAWFDLEPGEERDLGTLETTPGGALRIRVDRAADVRGQEVELAVVGPGSGPFEPYFSFKRSVLADSSEVVVDGVAPGDYRVRVRSAGLGARPASVQVVAGETNTVELSVEAATRVDFELVNPGDEAWGELELALRRSGAPFDDRTLSHERAVLPYTLGVLLPSGAYEVRATTDTGLAATLTFDVDAHGGLDEPLRLELRRP